MSLSYWRVFCCLWLDQVHGDDNDDKEDADTLLLKLHLTAFSLGNSLQFKNLSVVFLINSNVEFLVINSDLLQI